MCALDLAVQPPSWELLVALIERTSRPEPWLSAGRWAIEQLRAVLGDQWPHKAARAGVPPWPELVTMGFHTVGFAAAMEWALRLRLVSDADGVADFTRDLARDVKVGRALHSGLQLEVAGLARRLDWPVRLEPAGSDSPGDVALLAPTETTLTVETRVLTERVRPRHERASISQITSRLTLTATARRLWLAGDMHRVPSAEEVGRIERWIATAQRSERLADIDGVSLYVVDPDEAVGHALRGPAVADELFDRMVRAIADKAGQMRSSGAGWLRLTLFTGLWPLTPWGRAPLAEKLRTMASAPRAELGDVHA